MRLIADCAAIDGVPVRPAARLQALAERRCAHFEQRPGRLYLWAPLARPIVVAMRVAIAVAAVVVAMFIAMLLGLITIVPAVAPSGPKSR